MHCNPEPSIVAYNIDSEPRPATWTVTLTFPLNLRRTAFNIGFPTRTFHNLHLHTSHILMVGNRKQSRPYYLKNGLQWASTDKRGAPLPTRASYIVLYRPRGPEWQVPPDRPFQPGRFPSRPSTSLKPVLAWVVGPTRLPLPTRAMFKSSTVGKPFVAWVASPTRPPLPTRVPTSMWGLQPFVAGEPTTLDQSLLLQKALTLGSALPCLC